MVRLGNQLVVETKVQSGHGITMPQNGQSEPEIFFRCHLLDNSIKIILMTHQVAICKETKSQEQTKFNQCPQIKDQ